MKRGDLIGQLNRALCLAVALAVMLVALPWSPAGAANRPVRISIPARSPSFSFLFVGKEKKFYEEAGIDLKITVVRGPGALQAMFAGSVQFSSSGAHVVIKSRSVGLTPIMVAGGNERLSMEIIADKEKAAAMGITEQSSWQDRLKFLRGSNIGLARTGALAHFYLLYAVAKAGLDPKKDLTITIVGKPAALFANLERKRIDGFVFVPPVTVFPVVKGNGIRLASGPMNSFPEIFPYAVSCLLTMDSTIKNDRELVRRMVHAWVKSLKFINEHPEEAKAILRGTFKTISPPVLNEALRLVIPAVSKDGRIVHSAVETAQKFLLDGGAIKQPIDLKTTYTNEFLPN